MPSCHHPHAIPCAMIMHDMPSLLSTHARRARCRPCHAHDPGTGLGSPVLPIQPLHTNQFKACTLEPGCPNSRSPTQNTPVHFTCSVRRSPSPPPPGSFPSICPRQYLCPIMTATGYSTAAHVAAAQKHPRQISNLHLLTVILHECTLPLPQLMPHRRGGGTRPPGRFKGAHGH